MAVIRFRGRRASRLLSNGLLLPLALAVGGLGGISLNAVPSLSTLLLDTPVRPQVVFARDFPVCTGGARVTCVVDGDTFWLEGTKFRIADINTPEVSQPACIAEARLGRQATMRLAELLQAGPFELGPADRDEDRYGRKLRIVMRDGQSIGVKMVAEGLAHPWGGQREGWC